jgi:hypothetical protein
MVIEAKAFIGCEQLLHVTFAAASKLVRIDGEAFSDSPLETFVVPASIKLLNAFAFSESVWRSLRFEGAPLYVIERDFLLSVDRTKDICRCFSNRGTVRISNEHSCSWISTDAFRGSGITTIYFEDDILVKFFGSGAFAGCTELAEFRVPRSTEILYSECFANCSKLEIITFEEPSVLKRIDRRAFMCCKLHSITIPAATQEIDGSAFLNCPLHEVRVSPENHHFRVRGTFLVTHNGSEIVRYFGQDREVLVGKEVKVLGKSCFEGCHHIDGVIFAKGSGLQRIDAAALRGCTSLTAIAIPASVQIIQEASFEDCDALEDCLMDRNSSLSEIGSDAFAKCTSLRSFDIPRRVVRVGRNCFSKSTYLTRLRFRLSESLKRVVGRRSLDDALDELGVSGNSSLFKIEIDDGGVDLKFAGWSGKTVRDGDGDLHIALVRDFQ